ncbi:DNA polymerase III subunit beta [Nonomuraea sp. K274]|uniref:Beta sliding clamp n=1 Tax=Nonomuraea cypriaca TaxID=1187855 RepID=A0A931F0P9_9ACTN|nr:DNA polymerase III subunit beta [Nonomuraea cypriaca]MBF8187356.1 DNA polymerase III subunit beta [Nonomuraea cypriaca]
MKFTIMAGELADAVGWASHALPKRAPVPVLGGILIEAGDDGVELSAYDYDTSRRIAVELDAPAVAGRVLLPGRTLCEVVKAFPKNGLVDVAVDDREAVLRCGRSEYGLPLMPVDDFPTLPKVPELVGAVDSKALADAVAHVVASAGKDNTLPMLTCVRVDVGDGCIDLAATDRYRIAWRTNLPWEPALDAGGHGLMIPARALHDIARSLPDGQVQVGIGGGLAAFTSEGRTTTIGLLDDQFIDYKARMKVDAKVDAKVTAEVDADVLVKVVKRVALVAERHASVRLSFTQGGVLVEAGGADAGRAAEHVDCTLDGDDIRVGFTPQYLLDGLQAVGGVAKLEMETSTKPVMITGSGDAGLRYLVVPIRLSA